MTRRNLPAKWVLPEVVNPPTSTCYMVQVPDDPQHKAAFLGALADLGSAYKWQDDPDHKARDVAIVWRNIADNLSECGDVIQFRQSDICTLQVSFDAGVTWTDIYNGMDCAREGARYEIQDQIDDGHLSGGGQQDGGGQGVPGQCYDYDITLEATNRWLAPVALREGDTIEVTRATGAWWDGDLLHVWRCVSGHEFALGRCLTGDAGTRDRDPLPDSPNMILIGNLPEDATVPYFEMFNTAYTVPYGVGSGNLYIQTNDDILTDNQGSVNFHIQICKSAETCHLFDFTIDEYGWVIGTGVLPCDNTYSPTVGYVACDDGAGDYYILIKKSFSVAFITNVTIGYDSSVTYNDSSSGLIFEGYLSGVRVVNEIIRPVTSGLHYYTKAFNQSCDEIRLYLEVNSTVSHPATHEFKSANVCFTGSDPF